MKTLKYLFVAAAFMSATPFALAADLPLRGPMPQPVAMAAAPAQEDYSGLYLRGDIGVGISNVNSVTRSAAQLTSFSSTFNEISPNTNIGVGIGYAWNSWLRTDATLEYRGGARVTGAYGYGVVGGGTGQDHYHANLSQVVGLANAYIDLGTFAGITPYIGAGIGFAHNRLGATTVAGVSCPPGCGAPAPTSEMITPGSKTNLAWGLMAGLSYDVTRNAKLELGYRYLNTGGITSGTTGLFGCNCSAATNPLVSDKVTSHDLRIGMRWMLANGPAAIQPPLMRRF